MPHRIDIDSVKKNVFLLRNLAYAGKKFSASNDLDYFSELNHDDAVNYNYYFGWLRFCLSEMLIDCAIKVRIIHDIIIKEHRESVEFDGEFDFEEVKDFPFKFPTTHNIGFFSTGSGNLTLRETLN